MRSASQARGCKAAAASTAPANHAEACRRQRARAPLHTDTGEVRAMQSVGERGTENDKGFGWVATCCRLAPSQLERCAAAGRSCVAHAALGGVQRDVWRMVYTRVRLHPL